MEKVKNHTIHKRINYYVNFLGGLLDFLDFS